MTTHLRELPRPRVHLQGRRHERKSEQSSAADLQGFCFCALCFTSTGPTTTGCSDSALVSRPLWGIASSGTCCSAARTVRKLTSLSDHRGLSCRMRLTNALTQYLHWKPSHHRAYCICSSVVLASPAAQRSNQRAVSDHALRLPVDCLAHAVRSASRPVCNMDRRPGVPAPQTRPCSLGALML